MTFSTYEERPLRVQAALWTGDLPDGWFNGELDAFWELLKGHGAKFSDMGQTPVIQIKNVYYDVTFQPGNYIVFSEPTEKYPGGIFRASNKDVFERRFAEVEHA